MCRGSAANSTRIRAVQGGGHGSRLRRSFTILFCENFSRAKIRTSSGSNSADHGRDPRFDQHAQTGHFLEDHFGIRIEAYEAGVEHLDTIQQIAELVAGKKNAA